MSAEDSPNRIESSPEEDDMMLLDDDVFGYVNNINASSSSSSPTAGGPAEAYLSSSQRGKNRTWDESFADLKIYKECYGHTNVPYYFEHDRSLGEWVNRQRKHPELLTKEQQQKLEFLGFNWLSTQERLWNEKFERLIAYAAKHPTMNFKGRYNDGQEGDLSNWVAKQRSAQSQGRLTKERFEKLNAIPNFAWRKKLYPKARVSAGEDMKWKDKFARLLAYKEQFGTTTVPFQWECDKSLGRWVNEMRTQNTRGILRPERKELLEQVGFVWRIHRGESKLSSAKNARTVKKQPGVALAPTTTGPVVSGPSAITAQHQLPTAQVPTATALVSGPSTSIAQHPTAKGRTTKKRKARIVSDSSDEEYKKRRQAKLDFDHAKQNFDPMYQRVADFHKKHGHLDLPSEKDDGALRSWLEAMRRRGHAGLLTRDEAKKLLAIGALAYGKSQIWQDSYSQLCKFRIQFGHTCVSARDDLDLATWTSSQRVQFQQGKLSKSRKERLEKIGFDFHTGNKAGKISFQIGERSMNCHGKQSTEGLGSFLAAANAWVA